jgi:hypothetical protein
VEPERLAEGREDEGERIPVIAE